MLDIMVRQSHSYEPRISLGTSRRGRRYCDRTSNDWPASRGRLEITRLKDDVSLVLVEQIISDCKSDPGYLHA